MSSIIKEADLVVVSGGNRGLGLAISKDLLVRGYRVFAFSQESTLEVDKLLEHYRNKFFFGTADLKNKDSLDDLIKYIESKVGPIYGLVNNAGVVDETLFCWQDQIEIENLIAVNLRGSIWLTQAIVKRMMIRRRGRIVSISSIMGNRGFPGVVTYSATKGGINAMTRSLAHELGGRGITVNVVSPGYMETDMTKDLNQIQINDMIRRTPLQRQGQLTDVAGPVAFFLSEEARFVTGQDLVVDGGLTC